MKKLPKRGQLLPTLTTSVKRTVWDLRLPGGDEVECVIDQGNIEANDATAPVSELELELKSGDPKHLFDLALQLQQDVPMQIGNFSKADRGYDLLTPRPFVAVKATPVQLQPRMSIEEAFKSIVINCLAQIQSNQPGLFVQHDADSLHQMRVGLRRLRSALAMFEDHIACPAEIVSELRWLGLTLGAARNWDVLKASTLPGLRGLMADADILQPLHEAVENKIRLNHETVAAAAGSPRYTTLILTFLRWVEAMEWRNALSVPALRRIAKPVDNFARETIQQDQRRLKKRGRNLQAADAPTRHRLRIAVKRARYASEFFASLYPQKSVQQYVKSLALLQENLGLLNDVAVAKILMREIEASQPELRVEAAYVLGYMACRLGQDDTGLLKQWRRLKATAVPRMNRH